MSEKNKKRNRFLNRKMLVMNVELNWLDPLSGLEVEAFMKIVNQFNSEDNMEKSEIMF